MLTEFQLIYVGKNVLEDLGIDVDQEYYVDSGYLNLERIEAVCPCEGVHDGKPTINIGMFSGETFTALISLDEFNSLLK